jgi:FAD/FMN-containing dehydrogenase
MTHEEKIKKITEEIRARAGSGQPVIFSKKSVSHLVPSPDDPRGKWPKVFIGDLTEIIEIDVNNKTCTAEAGTTFSDVVQKTLPLGLMPYVVPELKTITLGGAVSGCSIESMSYKYGGFHDSCLEYEIITGQGEKIIVSRGQNADIFEMIHGSYGTLGLLSGIKFKLHPAAPFVRLEYVTLPNFAEFRAYLMERCERGDYTFVDAIIHGKDKFIVCLGNMVKEAPYVSKYDLRIFYKSTLRRTEDYMTTYDYFYRYDRECHWLSRAVPPLEWMPVRLLFGKFFLGSTNLIKWSKRAGKYLNPDGRPEVIVDVFIPSRKFEEFYYWYEKEFNFYPLWIVPYRMPAIYPWINPSFAAKNGENFFIDCAIYGKKNNNPKIDYSEMLENKVFDLGGIKTLISRNHYSQEKFWQIYDKKKYDKIKQRTDPNGIFGSVYGNMVLQK